MNRGQIKIAIKNAVDDSTVDSAILNQWIQDADDAVQTWKPPLDQNQTFDWWDFLKDKKNYQSISGTQKYSLPDNYRAFVELKIADDEDPYILIDYRDRGKYSDHAAYIYGKYFYVIATPSEIKTMEFSFVRFTEEFTNDNDEPEIERIYHQAYVEFGKKQYYGQQSDTELENKAESNFEKIMMKKWRDQELNRMATASDRAGIALSAIV